MNPTVLKTKYGRFSLKDETIFYITYEAGFTIKGISDTVTEEEFIEQHTKLLKQGLDYPGGETGAVIVRFLRVDPTTFITLPRVINRRKHWWGDDVFVLSKTMWENPFRYKFVEKQFLVNTKEERLQKYSEWLDNRPLSFKEHSVRHLGDRDLCVDNGPDVAWCEILIEKVAIWKYIEKVVEND